MKKIFTSLLALLPFAISAQTVVADSVVLGNSYNNKAFYSLSNGIQATVPNDNWDLQFASSGPLTSSIRLNGGFNVAAWLYTAGDTADWSTLDTAGLGAASNWQRIYDAVNDYDPGAFESTATGFPNYGWGNYIMGTNNLIGDKLYVVRTLNGAFKKVWIKILRATTQTFELKVANLDGSGEVDLVVDRSATTNKNFLYLNLNSGLTLNFEPARGTYELVFEKYEGFLPSSSTYYPVSGVRFALGIEGARVAGVHVDDVNYLDYTMVSDIITIGHDWKTFAGGWSLADSTSFLIETANEDVYQIWFTGFTGMSTGIFRFNKRLLGNLSNESISEVVTKTEIYPNPSSDIVNVQVGESSGTVFLVDLSGRILRQSDLNQGKTQIDVRGLTPGMYVIRGFTAGVPFSSKVMVH
jgi:hypothetical protein